MNKQYSILTGFVVSVVCLFTTANGQNAWGKKPYTEWSMNEALRILTDSPWAQLQAENVRIAGSVVANSYFAFIRLRSALPIRQALLRQKQLQMDYDKFTPADKVRFDNETREFLDCPDCAKHYIVTIRTPAPPNSPSEFIHVDVVSTLKNLSLTEVRPYIFLENDKGERRELVHFVPPKEPRLEAMFLFQRFNDAGQPLVTIDNKRFYFKIDEKLFYKRSVPLKNFKFDVSKLTVNGQILF